MFRHTRVTAFTLFIVLALGAIVLPVKNVRAIMGSTTSLLDYDNDGLSNEYEDYLGTNPWSKDTDGDTLNDGDEVLIVDSNPRSMDTDSDGLIDPDEVKHGTPARDPDIDEDDLKDAIEIEKGTNPYNADTDGDLLKDAVELFLSFTDPVVKDTDEDGLPDGREYLYLQTDPNVADTDGDGHTDSLEVQAGSDPLDFFSTPQ